MRKRFSPAPPVQKTLYRGRGYRYWLGSECREILFLFVDIFPFLWYTVDKYNVETEDWAMKLAEALQERADLRRVIGQLEARIVNNARIAEGTTPTEDPAELIRTLDGAMDRLAALITAINGTNSVTVVDGRSLTEWIAQRDTLKEKIEIYWRLVNEASEVTRRMTHSEIRIVPAVDVPTLNRQTDKMAKELRLMDNRIQAANWTTELIGLD